MESSNELERHISAQVPVRIEKAWLGQGSFVVLDVAGPDSGLRSIWIQNAAWELSVNMAPVLDHELQDRSQAEACIKELDGRTVDSICYGGNNFQIAISGGWEFHVRPCELDDGEEDVIVFFFSSGGGIAFSSRERFIRFSKDSV